MIKKLKVDLGLWQGDRAPVLGMWRGARRAVGWLVREPDGEYVLRDLIFRTDCPERFRLPELALVWMEVYLDRPPEYTKEDAISELLDKFGDQEWYWDVRECTDDAGLRLEVTVDRETYPKSDPLPRRIGPPDEEVFLVVTSIQRVASPPDV